jgi:hypothetical protein
VKTIAILLLLSGSLFARPQNLIQSADAYYHTCKDFAGMTPSTAKELTGDKKLDAVACTAYTAGLLDGLSAYRNFDIAMSEPLHIAKPNPLPEIKPGRALTLTIRYMEQHPTVLHDTGTFFIMKDAVIEAYPPY